MRLTVESSRLSSSEMVMIVAQAHTAESFRAIFCTEKEASSMSV